MQGGYEGFIKTGFSGSMALDMTAFGAIDTMVKGSAVKANPITGRLPGFKHLYSFLDKNKVTSAALQRMSKSVFMGKLGAITNVWMSGLMGGMAGTMSTMAIGALGDYGLQQGAEKRRKKFTGNVEMYGEGFRDTKNAQTMRQTALSMVQQSQLGVRSALGREAFHMHR